MRAIHHLHKPDITASFPLLRRGIALGWVSHHHAQPTIATPHCRQQWQQLHAVPLPNIVAKRCTTLQPAIDHAHNTMAAIVNGTPPSSLMSSTCNHGNTTFDLTTISADEHDQQAIEKLYFQAWDGDTMMDEVWCKASWLSFHDDDASLRFRFSFGTEGVEPVATYPAQQQLAADLCQQLFPESAAITDNPPLQSVIQQTLEIDSIAFVECIVYFNAPQGGALFHHDVEPGHAGVIYAQLSGTTFWLALAKAQLIEAIKAFADQHNIVLPSDVAAELNRTEHPDIEAIIDHNPQFIHQLVADGYGYILHAGDALLLAQSSEEACVWHSVFCLGDEPGEGLSFAMRPG